MSTSRPIDDTRSSAVRDGLSEKDDPAPGSNAARSSVARGVAWKGTSTFFLLATRFVVAMILARLLTPHEYGLAGMAIVLSSLVFIFSDLSLGAALIQRPVLTEQDRSTVFWTSAGVGLLLTVLGVALSGPVASFYGQPEVQPLFAAMSLTFLVASVSSTQMALLTRDMNFRTLELRKMAAAVASAAVGLSLAVAGFGPWAIVGQELVVALVSAVLLWIASSWRPRLTFSRTSLRDLVGFSGHVFGARLLFYLNRNADNLLVGRYLGAAALGAYSVAYNLMLMPSSQISIPVQDVMVPAFARMQDDVRGLARTWLRTNRLVGALTVPALVGLVILAPDFVHVVLGHKWSSVTPVLQILCWVGLLQSLQGLNGSVLRARNRTSVLFRYSIVVTVASLTAFVVGLPWGIVGVATAYAISSTVVEPYYTWLTCRAVDISLWAFVRSLAGVAQATLMMAAALVLGRMVLVGEGFSPLVRLLVLVGLGAVVYLACLAWRAPDVRGDVARFRRRRLTPGPAPG